MKIRITKPGIFGADGAIEIGTEITLSGEPPVGWAGKYEVVQAPTKADAKPVTNPKKD